MSAFGAETKTIHDNSWDDGEEVVIREPTYGESSKMAKACTRSDGNLDNLKYADMLLPAAIVSWTFKRDGKDVPVNLTNIRELPTSYARFMVERIGEFTPVTDAEFPAEAESGA